MLDLFLLEFLHLLIEKKFQYRAILNAVVGVSVAVQKLFVGKKDSLLVRVNPLLVIYLLLYVKYCVGGL